MHNNLKKKKVQQKLYYQTAGKKYSFSNELASGRVARGNKAGRVSKTTLLAIALPGIALPKAMQANRYAAFAEQGNAAEQAMQGRARAKNKIFLHTKKAFCLIQKHYWFYDNAAPIPGVSLRSVKKRKALG